MSACCEYLLWSRTPAHLSRKEYAPSPSSYAHSPGPKGVLHSELLLLLLEDGALVLHAGELALELVVLLSEALELLLGLGEDGLELLLDPLFPLRSQRRDTPLSGYDGYQPGRVT